MTGYIIKLVLCSGILLLAYMLLFQKERMHRFNRWYLLLSLVFPLLVPFINIEGQQEVIPFSEPVYVVIPDDQTLPVTVGPVLKNEELSADPIVLIYVAVTTFLLLRFVKNLVALVKKDKKT